MDSMASRKIHHQWRFLAGNIIKYLHGLAKLSMIFEGFMIFDIDILGILDDFIIWIICIYDLWIYIIWGFYMILLYGFTI
jgi:hypothetical protein